MKLRSLLFCALTAICVAGVSGCGSTTSLFGADETAKVDNRPADVMYKEADDYLGKGSYNKAAALFEQIDQLYPYSEESKKAMLLAAEAYRKAGKLPEAVAAARRFLALHPGAKEADSAQYIIAMSFYDRINGPSRDQSDTKKAMDEIDTLIKRYPNSHFAQEAKLRLKLSRDNLAAAEMNIARGYQKKGNYLAAVNRYKTVVSEYQQTSHVEEALMRLTECYMALGVVSEAQTATAVLGHNFPDSPWYKDAYALLKSGGTEPREDNGSWISQSWKAAVTKVTG